MPLTIPEFASMVRSKYGAYQGVDDVELTARIVAKYPEYRSQVQMDPRTEIAVRKIAPPATALGDPRGEQDSPGFMDYVQAGVRGVGKAVTGVGSLADMMTPAGPAMLASSLGQSAATNTAANMAEHGGISTKSITQTAADTLLPPLGAAIRPSMVASDRPPTNDERLGAMEGVAEVGAGFALGARGNTLQKYAPGAAEALRAVPDTIANQAPKMANTFINAKKAAFTYGANPGKEVAGLKFNSPEELVGQLTEKIKMYDEAAAKVYNAPDLAGKVVDVEGAITKSFMEPLKAARDRGVSTTPLENALAAQIRMAREMNGGRQIYSPANANAVKQRMGDLTRWKHGMTEEAVTVNDALQSAYQGIKTQLDTMAPVAKQINERTANALTARNAAEAMVVEGLKWEPTQLLNPKSWLNSPSLRSRVISGMYGERGAFAAPDVPNAPAIDIETGAPVAGDYSRARPTATRPAPQPVGTFAAAEEGGAIQLSPGGVDVDPNLPMLMDRADARTYRQQMVYGNEPQPASFQREFAAGDQGGAIPFDPAVEDVFRLHDAGRISAEDFNAWLNSRGSQANSAMLRYSGSPGSAAARRVQAARDAASLDNAVAAVLKDGGGNPDVARQGLSAKRAVYQQQDGTQVPVPNALYNAFVNGDWTAATSPVMRWLEGMRKSGKIKSGGQLVFIER
jgi:hypothetical protein